MKHDVAVVGTGFSAIAVTINLMRQLPTSAGIAVVGDDPGFGACRIFACSRKAWPAPFAQPLSGNRLKLIKRRCVPPSR
jgi:hypothetical protein